MVFPNDIFADVVNDRKHIELHARRPKAHGHPIPTQAQRAQYPRGATPRTPTPPPKPSLPPVREGSALDALSALEHAPDSPPTYDEITKLSHKQAPDAVDPAELKGGGGGVDESADLRLQEDEDDATRGLKEQDATVAEKDDKMRESAVVVETQTEVCVERETSRKGDGGKKGKRRGKRGAVVGAQ